MKIVCHPPRRKYDPTRFTIRGINRETLSLLLTFAQEGMERPENVGKYSDMVELCKTIDDWINNEDSVVRLTPLEI